MGKNIGLVRNGALEKLRLGGYRGQGRVLKNKELKEALHSLFLQRLEESEECRSENQLKTIYADMLEIMKAYMAANNISAKEVKLTVNQPMQWYKSFASAEVRYQSAKLDLLQRFEELKHIKSEEVKKDQFNDIFNAFNTFIEAKKQNLVKVDNRRKEIAKQAGDYSKGLCLGEVVKEKRYTI